MPRIPTATPRRSRATLPILLSVDDLRTLARNDDHARQSVENFKLKDKADRARLKAGTARTRRPPAVEAAKARQQVAQLAAPSATAKAGATVAKLEAQYARATASTKAKAAARRRTATR